MWEWPQVGNGKMPIEWSKLILDQNQSKLLVKENNVLMSLSKTWKLKRELMLDREGNR